MKKPFYSFCIKQLVIIAFAIPVMLCSVSDSINAKTTDYTTISTSSYKGTYKIIPSDNVPSLIVPNKKASVKSIVEQNDYSYGINASAWNSSGNMDMLAVNGTWIVDNNLAYIGDPLILDSDYNLQAIGYDYATTDFIDEYDPIWVLTGFNAVIYDTYYTNTDWDTKHNRSFIGQFQNGDYIIGVLENATYSDLISFARDNWGYNIRILYNLDGGGSCGLYLDEQSIYSGRKVKTIIAF